MPRVQSERRQAVAGTLAAASLFERTDELGAARLDPSPNLLDERTSTVGRCAVTTVLLADQHSLGAAPELYLALLQTRLR